MHDGREGGSHDTARELQQGWRYHLSNQRLAVTQHQSQQRAYDSGLSLTHDHLLHHRFAAPQCTHEVSHKDDLCLTKQDIPSKFEDQESWICYSVVYKYNCLSSNKEELTIHQGRISGIDEMTLARQVNGKRFALIEQCDGYHYAFGAG